jgi:glutamate-1-semialdehyde 2,1-aminomutase
MASIDTKISIGQQRYNRAREIIPGGTGLFGFRQELRAPDQWPPYFDEADGCEVVDLDGRRYIDMSTCGIGATVLGYRDPDVTAAVVDRVQRGTLTVLNPPDEVELAELLLQIHPWGEMVRLGRLGGETMVLAIRLARASTGRDKVAFCGYHGWHDWYLAANLAAEGDYVDNLGNWHLIPGLEPKGIPRGLAGTSLPFTYNKIDELKAIVDRHGSDLAAICMEPTRNLSPEPGFLESVRELADKCGAKLIFDEITIGWKLCLGGAHLKFGIVPDLAVFAKTLGNGHPIAAVVGKAETMQAYHDTFISSAFWSEAVGPAAGVATVRKMMSVDVPAHLDRIGRLFRDGMAELAGSHKLSLSFSGNPALQTYTFDHPSAAALQTLMTVRMLDQGFLVGGGFYPMFAHTDDHVRAYLAACDTIFAELAAGIIADDIEARIGGPVKHSGIRRLA